MSDREGERQLNVCPKYYEASVAYLSERPWARPESMKQTEIEVSDSVSNPKPEVTVRALITYWYFCCSGLLVRP